MGKIVYSWVIRRDSKIPGTVVRSSTIPEQLGRISYLLTDKTGIYVENTVLSHGMLLFGLRYIFGQPESIMYDFFGLEEICISCHFDMI